MSFASRQGEYHDPLQVSLQAAGLPRAKDLSAASRASKKEPGNSKAKQSQLVFTLETAKPLSIHL